MGRSHRSRSSAGKPRSAGRAARAAARTAVLRSRLPVHVSRHRARRARVPARHLDAPRRRRRCSAARLADDPEGVERVRAAAERRAAELRLPLVWPERFPREVPAAMRAAAFAAEQGRGGAFVLAAGRLAFCGGFDLDDPEILAEAAAAAGIPLEDCFHAAGDARARRRGRGDRAAAAGGGRRPAAGAARRALAVLGRAARRRRGGVGAPGDPGARAPGL